MIKKHSGMSKEFGWVFLLLIFFALYLVKVAFQQSPFNSFEDDASWLVPSLAWDMSSLSWHEQLARDIGERGAISLNMMLRFLYLIFEGWPTGYILFGILAHTISVSLLFVALRKCGFTRAISLATAICFFFCSLQFHAIFWIVGVQHVLAVGSIFATCIIAQHIFRLEYCQYRKPAFWRYVLVFALLLMLGFNRASIVINVFTWSLFFIYYALKLGSAIDKRARHSAIWCWRLYGFYIVGMLAIPAFSFYQLSHQGEGWQVINALQHAGIQVLFIQYFSNIPHLYIGLIIFLVSICALTFFASTYLSPMIRNNFATLCYFSGIIGIAAILIFLENTRHVLPAILENLFFIPNIEGFEQHWNPLDSYQFASSGGTNVVNTALYLALLVTFALVRPKKNSAQLLCSILFLMVALGLIYFNSLSHSFLKLNALPSRYAYYFTPSILLGMLLILTKVLSLNLVSFGDGSRMRLFLHTWQLAKKFVLAFFVFSFVLLNTLMLGERLDHHKVTGFTHGFANYANLGPSFLLGEKISLWAKASKHTGDISINLSGIKDNGWNGHPSLNSFIPPAASVFHPFLFGAQAYLTQMIGMNVRLHPVTEGGDIMLCGGEWYGKTKRHATIEIPKCKYETNIGDLLTPNQFLQAGGDELQLLKPRRMQDSLLIRGALRSHFDPLTPRYKASLAEGISFEKPGFPLFLADVSGMSGLENWGRWTNEPIAKFRFNQTLPSTFTLSLCFGATGANIGKAAIVRVGNIEKQLMVTSPAGTEYSLNFEGIEHAHTIEIIPFSHASPFETDSKNPDKRSLGLAMIYLKIK